MTKDEPVPEADAAEATVSWREQAVARSLDSARTRAENRVQRFLDAALELMNEGDSGKDFTVQEVVERSGQSLRSFYQYFGGKHELLLALFEESVRSTAEILQQEDGPGGRCTRSPALLRGRVLPHLPVDREQGVDQQVVASQACERQVVEGQDAESRSRAGHGRLRPEAADRLPDRSRGRLRPAGVAVRRGARRRCRRRAPFAQACATARSPASCSRPSCSTPSP